MEESAGDRLKEARDAAGYRSAKAAADALGISYPTYAAHENGHRSIQRDMAILYAKRFRVGLDWLLTGKGQKETKTRMVAVTGFVQAGEWTEGTDWGGSWNDDTGFQGDIMYEVPVPDSPELERHVLFGAQVRGNSMDKRYAPGSTLVFTSIYDTHEELEVGKRYIVQRESADGTYETTVKTLWQDERGQYWLLPESTDPRFQQPIPFEGKEGDTIRIIGRVRYVVGVE